MGTEGDSQNDGPTSSYTSQDYYTAESFQGHGPVIPIELRRFEKENRISLYRLLLGCGVKVEGLVENFSMPEAFSSVGFERQGVAVGPVEGELGFSFRRIDSKSFRLHLRTEEGTQVMKLSYCDFTDDSLGRLIFQDGQPNVRAYLRKILFDKDSHTLQLIIGDKSQDSKGEDVLKFTSTIQLGGRVEEL